MTRVAALVVALVLGLTTPAVALTTYYVAPHSTTAHTGAAATPWISLDSSAWSKINATLATDDVTVYFSARNASSDTNTESTVSIALDRTDGSTHRLTLDGISQYSTSDTSPVWVPHITPSPSNYKAASKFQITSTYPINSNNGSTPYPDRNYITIRGFRIIATDGQMINCTGCNNLIIEYNEGSHTATVTTGPGFLTGIPCAANPRATPSCNGAMTGGTWSSHVIIRYNYVHNTEGECIYIGGSTPDPDDCDPATPTSSPCTQGHGFTNTDYTVATGTDILIQGNTIADCAFFGTGEGDGIDVKDGNTNVRILHNTITYSAFTPPTLPVGAMEIMSCSVIDGNFISGSQANGIFLAGAWNNTIGHTSCRISNNIIVGNTGFGIAIYYGNSNTYAWQSPAIYNNTVYNNTGDGIACVNNGAIICAVTAASENNLVWNNGGTQFNNGVAGAFTAHNNNDYFKAAGGTVVNDGGTTYTAATITTYEAQSKSVDPLVVNTATPYVDTNFKLRAGSPGIGTALNLSATFTTDYAGLTRGTPWDMGAWANRVGSVPAPPTQLRLW